MAAGVDGAQRPAGPVGVWPVIAAGVRGAALAVAGAALADIMIAAGVWGAGLPLELEAMEAGGEPEIPLARGDAGAPAGRHGVCGTAKAPGGAGVMGTMLSPSPPAAARAGGAAPRRMPELTRKDPERGAVKAGVAGAGTDDRGPAGV